MPTTINRRNLSTTADQDDIFVLASAGEKLNNFGALTTSGNLASPIRVAADGISVSNFGSLITNGDGSPAVTVGDYFGDHFDNVTVINHGTITTTGNLLDDGTNFAFADGISAYGNNTKIINFGTISATGVLVSGVYTVGIDVLVTNYGTIESSDFFGIFADDDFFPFYFSDHSAPFDATANHNVITNYGEIHLVAGETAGAGIAMMAWGAESIARNYGTILLDGDYPFFVDGLDAALPGSLAENYGQIYATADIAIGIGIFFGDNLARNYGTIQLEGAFSVGMHLDGGNSRGENYGTVLVSDATSLGVQLGRLPHHTGNIGGAEFTNYGTIQTVGTAVLGSEYGDVVTNRGVLVGDVSLGAGDDTYVAGAKGQLDGVLTLGDGDDLVIVERNAGELTINDFVAGLTSDDVIDLSAFGFDSFAELMGEASQSGADLIFDLQGNTELVLQNVSFGSLSLDDFVLDGANGQVLTIDHLFAALPGSAGSAAEAIAIYGMGEEGAGSPLHAFGSIQFPALEMMPIHQDALAAA